MLEASSALRPQKRAIGCKEPIFLSFLSLSVIQKYYTSVNNTAFILYTVVYMSGRHVST